MGSAPTRHGKSTKKSATSTRKRGSAALGRSQLAQVRLRVEEVQALQEVMRTLHLGSTSDALREGLRLLAREAAEVGAAEEIRTFYDGQSAPRPEGVTEPSEEELAAADESQW